MSRRPTLAAALAAVLLGLLLPPSAGAAARPVPCAGSCWEPRPTVRPWQIQLAGRIDVTVPAPVVEVDCDGTPAATVRALQRRGAKVLGYIDAGSLESYRADAQRFPPAVVGRLYDGYPDERWLDVRRLDVLLPLLRDRLRTCARNGFDGVDPDNMNGYENDTGFPLTADDQVRFNRALADEAHRQGLAVVLKNTGGLVPRLRRWFDGAVVESCFRFRECAQYAPFVAARRPVYAIEYERAPDQFCAEARRRSFSAIFKRTSLSAFRRTC
ncbi:hypothetical protein DSM112329_05029 [Paraconexibacter sp. AEG42_29]|uniref:Glycoside-hydrolase family GH114 TIM-barrel domain-containing protein n=1 Tax=Paraconexibacter sp. AEG42_29 TaxID=2997339 RepID=A0AAU7B2L0_9ACTN